MANDSFQEVKQANLKTCLYLSTCNESNSDFKLQMHQDMTINKDFLEKVTRLNKITGWKFSGWHAAVLQFVYNIIKIAPYFCQLYQKSWTSPWMKCLSALNFCLFSAIIQQSVWKSRNQGDAHVLAGQKATWCNNPTNSQGCSCDPWIKTPYMFAWRSSLI